MADVHFDLILSPKVIPFNKKKKTCLTIKAPITTAADDILKYFFFNFSKKTSLDISCESSAIHMKYLDLFSLKN